MTLKIRSFLIIAIGAFYASICISADERDARNQIRNQVWSDIVNENFSRLEAQSKSYLDTRERTPSGLWKLTILNATIAEYMGEEFTLDSKEKNLKAWKKAHPESSAEYFSEIQLLLERADSITGLSGAHAIDPEAVDPYFRLIKRAREQLEAKKSVLRKDPRWYNLMLEIARLEKWEKPEFKNLASEAMDAHPYFYQNYFAIVDYIVAQRPIFSEEIETLAQSAVERTQAVDGMGMYARIYWYASQAHFDELIFNNTKASWPKMKTGFNDIMRKYPDNWNLNHYAKFACLSGDNATADHLFQMVKDDMIKSAWGPFALRNCTMPRPQQPVPAETFSML